MNKKIVSVVGALRPIALIPVLAMAAFALSARPESFQKTLGLTGACLSAVCYFSWLMVERKERVLWSGADGRLTRYGRGAWLVYGAACGLMLGYLAGLRFGYVDGANQAGCRLAVIGGVILVGGNYLGVMPPNS